MHYLVTNVLQLSLVCFPILIESAETSGQCWRWSHSDRFIFEQTALLSVNLNWCLSDCRVCSCFERNVLSWKSRCFQVVVRRLMRCVRANKHTIFRKYRPPQLHLAPHITLHTIDYTPPPLLNRNTNYCNIPPSSNYTTITLTAYTITPNPLPTSLS
jgi:hypothetical protein